jgi:hypothetical protein
MKLFFLLRLSASLASASAYTYTATGGGTSSLCGVDGNYDEPCGAYSLEIPQFDPALGTLESVEWTLTDGQSFLTGFNDIDQTPGQEFNYTTIGSDQSVMLGLNSSATDIMNAVTCGCRDVSGGSGDSDDLLLASGAVPNTSPFIGTGMAYIEILPSIDATDAVLTDGQDVGNQIITAAWGLKDNATLQITYVATPEARGYNWLVVALIVVLVFWLGRKGWI